MVKKLSILLLVSAASITLLADSGSGQAVEESQPKKQPEGTQQVTMHKTASGLQYEVLKEGSGTLAKAGQKATVHYTGWLNDNGKPGAQFDSSVDRGTPFSFQLGAGHVIKGWDLGVEGMKVGEKRRLVIPSELGYGSRGAGGRIPPNATLIFDVELLEVK